MKRSFVVVLATLTIGMTAFAYKNAPEYLNAQGNGGELRMVLSATDDDGNAVSNASVKVLMGMNFREKAYYISGKTDGKGREIRAVQFATVEVTASWRTYIRLQGSRDLTTGGNGFDC